MTNLIEPATLEIGEHELDRLLDAAEDLCRRGSDAEIDRRHRERYAFDCAVVLRRLTTDAAIASEPFEARARDISLWGISLRATGQFARHDRLAVEFSLPRSSGIQRTARLLVEVRHIIPDALGDKILGCAFREMLDAEVLS